MNVGIISGNIGSDLELKSTTNGIPTTSFSLAVKNYKNETKWFYVRAYRKQAENAVQYVGKGSKVIVTGEMNPYTYEKNGEKVNAFEIVANNIEFLDSKQTSNVQQSQQASAPDEFEIISDEGDLPFNCDR